MKLFEQNTKQFEEACAYLTTEQYMQAWNMMRDAQFNIAQDYIENIRQAQQAASLKAIEEILA